MIKNLFSTALIAIIFSLIMVDNTLVAQTKDQVKQEAEAKLQQMTPEQIDAAIKRYGITRSQAEAKANELGIDLESYLKGLGSVSSSAPSSTGSVVIVNPQTQPAINPEAQATAIEKAAEAVAVEEQKKETEILAKKTEPGEQDLFGQSLFKTDASHFEPTPSISDKDYIVGAGDVLKISLWGDAEFTSEFTIEKEGRLIIPSVGPVFVSGYSLEDAKKRIQVAMSKSYSGLVSSPPRIFMDLSISKLRPIRVFMMGEVMSPGGYFVSNFANVFNSLFVVGGPKVSGSMRDVRVIRNSKIVAKVDLYDYLIGNTKTNDIRVNDNDIIFVPLRSKTVTITGKVLRPYKFELLPNENLKKLMEFAGGIRSDIYSDRILVDRIIPFDQRVKGQPERKVLDVDFSEIVKGKKDFTLEDGDVISVYPILDIKENFAKIIGDVRRPGTYQIEKLKTLKDLIDAAEGFMPTAYLQRAELIRSYRNEKLEAITVDLEKVMKGDLSQNIILQPMDSLRVFSIYEINSKKNISISGHVKRPGTYPFAEGLSIQKILFDFGGYEDSVYKANTYLNKGYLYRLNEDLITRQLITFNVGDLLDSKKGNIDIIPGDQIKIFAKDEMEFVGGEVSIVGRVKRSGSLPILTNLTLFELVYQNVGLADTVFRESVLLDRADIVRYYPDRKSTYITRFNLWNLYTEQEGDTLLRPGDKIIIYARSAVEFDDDDVEIYGSVKNPGKYLRSKNMTLTDLILQAGGYTEDAWAFRGEVARLGRKTVGRDSLLFLSFPELPDFFDTTKSRLEILNSTSGKFRLQHRDQVFIRPNPDYQFQRLVTLFGEVTFPGKYPLLKRGEYLSSVIERAGGINRDGYTRGGKIIRGEKEIKFNMEEALDDAEGDEDILLREGDQVVIPFKPNSVQVLGEVNNPGLYGFNDGENLDYYIERAGGVTDSADFVLITYPEGYTFKSSLRWLFSENPEVPDGSKIFVTKIKPEPPEKETKESQSLDQTLRESITFLVSIVTLLVLLQQLR